MSDIFISYAREDEPRIRELANEFVRIGWSVWYDRNLLTSEEYDERIEQELDAALCVIVLWSHMSVKSKWVRAEAAAADEQGKLIPIQFDFDVVPPIRFRQLNMAKLSSPSLDNPSEGTVSMIAAIEAFTGKHLGITDTRTNEHLHVGKRSGAKTLTPGKWRLKTSLPYLFFQIKSQYDFELLPSGSLSCSITGTWLRMKMKSQGSGRWHFESSQGLLQLEYNAHGTAMGFQVSTGAVILNIRILQWDDDYSATCEFTHNNTMVQLERVFE